MEKAADNAEDAAGPRYVKVYDDSPDGYDGTCLRPLGLCELGGCCDACWYNPDHPRFHTGDRSDG
jgi:hypothetical protein